MDALKELLKRAAAATRGEGGQAIVEWLVVLSVVAAVGSLLYSSGIGDKIVQGVAEKVDQVLNLG